MAEKVDCGSDIDLRESNCLVNDQREFHCATYEFDIYYTYVSTMTQLSLSAPPYSPCVPFDDLELFLDYIN